MGREPLVEAPGLELTSFEAPPPTNNNYLHNDISCASNTPPDSHHQYLETSKRRRSNSLGPSDISERAAKKITEEDLFRHFFKKALTKSKGKKRSASPTFNSEFN